MNHNPYREISAYLDGEAEAPEQVGALLRDNPEACQRLESYRILRESLQAVPQPIIDASFTDRVMAATETNAGMVLFRRARVVLGGMAALFLLGLGAWLLAPMAERSGDTEAPLSAGVVEGEADAWVLAQLLEGEYALLSEAEEVYLAPWSEMDPLSPWETHHDEIFTSAPVDLDDLLAELAPDEEMALESLLLAYESGDLTL